MHGMIFAELQSYATARFGSGAWEALKKEAGLANRTYLTVADYPDEEAVALVGAAERISGKTASILLEDFGEFIVPDLLKLSGSLII